MHSTAFTNFFTDQQTLAEPAGHQLPVPHLLIDQVLSNVSTNPMEVCKILKHLEIGKAHGADGVSNRLLKNSADTVCKPLSKLINKSFNAGIVPISWKRANISPIHKRSQ
jgi:hypothetical protein